MLGHCKSLWCTDVAIQGDLSEEAGITLVRVPNALDPDWTGWAQTAGPQKPCEAGVDHPDEIPGGIGDLK